RDPVETTSNRFHGGIMATIAWSSLVDGQEVAFDPDNDSFVFDDTSISAADGHIDSNETLSVTQFSHDGKTITLDVNPFALTTTNCTVSNGSLLLAGDDATGTPGDDSANTLTGGSGDDQLIGAGGDDSVSGGAGDDRLLMIGAGGSGLFGNDTLDGGA